MLIPTRLPFTSTSAPPELPGWYGCVGLYEALESRDAQLVAPEAAHDAECHGLADAKRVADREHHVTDLHLFGLGESNRGQLRQLDLEHGQVGIGIGAHHASRDFSGIGQCDLDLVDRFDDVLVGENIAVVADDDTGAQPLAALDAGIKLLAEEIAEHRVVHEGCRGRLTSWLVKMLTTDGIALRAAPLNEVIVDWVGASCSGSGSLIVTTSLRRFQESKSGRSVETTNSTARQIVAVWQKVSQSLRMNQESVGLSADKLPMQNHWYQNGRTRKPKNFLEPAPALFGEHGQSFC